MYIARIMHAMIRFGSMQTYMSMGESNTAVSAYTMYRHLQ